jgi:hypothetical protein
MKLAAIGTGFLAASIVLSAQDPQKIAEEKRGMRYQTFTTEPTAINDNMMFFSREFGDESRAIKNAPYSADSITETTQMLADGNRITHKQTASTFRDGEGRTRREQSIDAIGPFAGKSMKVIHISDPVAGTSYTLDPESRTATKMPAIKLEQFSRIGKALPPGESVVYFKSEVRASDGTATAVREDIIGKKLSAEAKSAATAKRESLGKQMMEGLQVEGTRTTRTIAAGEIGNERQIDIVSERWYSPELQTTVMSRMMDPRSGETVFKLTNIRRSEPARYLFDVPTDYKISESGKFEVKVERRD